MAKEKEWYYAVAVGRRPGIYRTWPETEQQIKGFSKAKHEKFLTEDEARQFVKTYQSGNAIDTGNLNADVPRGEDDVEVLSQQLGSMGVRDTIQGGDMWAEELRARHDKHLVSFCAGSAPLNGREGCTAAYAVSFPLENIRTHAMALIDHPTNNRADCLAAKDA
ncbi:hypothetical protein PHYSODRAFT_285296, partial [Phytophthora sojae]